MLKQIVDSFFSKVGENLVEYGSVALRGKMNFKSTLETLEENLSSLSDKAFDFEEKIKHAELYGKKKRKREVEEWLKKVKIIENKVLALISKVQTQGFLKTFFNGCQATQLNARVHELVEQSRHFDELIVDVYEKRGETLLTTNLSGKGFEENLERIWNLLKSDKVSSIGIYGMGGVGKTTLARHINNIILEKIEEKRVCWITVSQVFSIKKLQDEIARFIGLNDLSDEDSEEKRAARLNKAISLTGNNFVLILDDVWEPICLQKLGDPLCLEGCKLILTTRLLDVCRRMGCQEKVEVKKLPPDAAWNLFKQTLGQDIALAPEVEEIAKSMAKVCDGLPLGIIVLAGSMRDETSIHVWRNELEKLRDPNMVHDYMEDEVFKILKHSFDRLDLNHRPCFLRCSLYLEDKEISKEELVGRFISEELVDIKKSRQSQLDQGYSILNKLVKVCLLESVSESEVKMHDLVRAMALKITKGKNIVISRLNSLREILTEGKWMKDLEKVSSMGIDLIETPDGMSLDCPNLTTLNFYKSSLQLITYSFFSKLDNLRFLRLWANNITKLPNSSSNLENVKALNLGNCIQLGDIPDLGKLKKLRELDLSYTGIKKGPQGMEELVNLRILTLHGARGLDILPKGLFLNFPLLQCLRLPWKIKAPIEEIVSLKYLEEFWGRVEHVSDVNKCITYRRSQVSMFNIMVHGRVIDFDPWPLSPRYGGNEVHVHQYDLKSEKEEYLNMLVHGIQHLTLERDEGLSNSLLDDFSKLNKPSSLKVLEINNCSGIECILTNEQFLTASQELESHFPPLQNLEDIRLIGLQNFTGLIQNIRAAVMPPLPQVAIFSSLRSLIICGCNKMRKLGLPLSEFQNLENIGIVNCNEIEEIIEVRDGDGEERVPVLKLKDLDLLNLPRLKSICNTRMVCGSLEIILLVGCPELKKMPLNFDPTSSSLKFCVQERDKEWWESLEWEHLTHSHLLQHLVHFF